MSVISAAPGRTAASVGVAAGRDAAVRLGAVVALWASLLLVTYWWVADGGVQDLLDPTAVQTSLGRLTGLIASDLLLVQVLLIARIPALERAFGQDRLIAGHRIVGISSFLLMLAHIALITVGYAAGSFTSVWATFVDLTVNYPGMLLALAGTLALIGVTVTSIRWARRRLRYESWHLLHLYAYLGVGLALPHQLWTGQAFTGSLPATVFWWGLWATAAAAILFFRVLQPLGRSLRHQLKVTSVVAEAPGIASVYLTGRAMHRLPALAGQFANFRFLDGEGWSRANPYSFSAAPDGRSLRVTVQAVGDGSRRATALRPGTRVIFEGPYGRLTERARTRDRVALIGAGSGIAPLRSLAEGLDYAPGEAVLLQRFSDQPLFDDEFRTLAAERGLDLVWLPGRRRTASSWLGWGAADLDDAAALRSFVPDIASRDLFICGPSGWTDAVTRAALRAGVPAEQLHVETFGW